MVKSTFAEKKDSGTTFGAPHYCSESNANQPIGTLLGLCSDPRRKSITYDSAESS